MSFSMFLIDFIANVLFRKYNSISVRVFLSMILLVLSFPFHLSFIVIDYPNSFSLILDSICSRSSSPRLLSHYHDSGHLVQPSESQASLSPSAHSSEDRPRSRTASHHSICPQSQPSRTGLYPKKSILNRCQLFSLHIKSVLKIVKYISMINYII